LKKNSLQGMVGILIVTVIVFSIYKNNDFIPNNNIFNNNVYSNDNQKATQNNNINSDSDSILKTVDMNTEVSTFGMRYKVNSVEKSKHIGPLPMPNLFDFLEFDKQGTIKNNYSYLIVNLAIQNDSEKEQEITLNSYNIYAKKNSDKEYTMKWEPMLYDKRTDVEKRDYFHFKLMPKEKVIFNLGYIAEDQLLEEYKSKMDLIINNGGTSNFYDKDVRIINIAF
jgi:hypothetical protein